MEKIRKVLLINTHLSYPNWSEGKLNDEFHSMTAASGDEKEAKILSKRTLSRILRQKLRIKYFDGLPTRFD